MLREQIQARISQEAFYKSLDKSEAECTKALEAGFVTLPNMHMAMYAPFDTAATSLTYQDGIRATLYGTRPRGSDGAMSEGELNQLYDELGKAMTVFSLFWGFYGLGGFINVWLTLEKTKMKHLQMATIMLITMEGPSQEELNQLFRDTLCDSAFNAASSLGGLAGTVIGNTNDMLDLAGHPIVSGCP